MTQLPEPHRLDGGNMPISWYKEALEYSHAQNLANKKEILRLKKILLRLHRVLGQA